MNKNFSEEAPTIDGKVFVFADASSDDYEAGAILLAEYGGIVKDAVDAETDYFVADDETDARLAEAQAAGVKVLSRDDFKKLLKAESPKRFNHYGGYSSKSFGELIALLENFYPPTEDKPLSDADEKLFAEKIAEGNDFFKAGKYGAAVRAYTAALKFKPNDARTYFMRGNAYANVSQYKQATDNFAIANYSKAIQLNPNFAKAYRNRGIVYRQYQGLFSSYKLAIPEFDKAIELNPNDALTYFYRGAAYAKWGDSHVTLHQSKERDEISNEYAHALQDLGKAIELNPNLADAYSLRGKVYVRVQQNEQALQDLDKAIALDPNCGAWVYYNRGQACCRLEQYERAIQDLSKFIEVNPDYDLAYSWRGKCYKALGENEKAAADDKKYRELRDAFIEEFTEQFMWR